MMTICRSTCK